MAGNKVGGAKAAKTNVSRYGTDYYVRIGRLGGSVKSPLKGFGGNPELASEAGRLGGMAPRKVSLGGADV